MHWELHDDHPIYAQLVDEIRLRIVSGTYPLGERLPSVRELAAEAAVNPNTMQRALTELERIGLVHTQRTSGRTVTEDAPLVLATREALASAQARAFLERMEQLGFSRQEAGAYLEKAIKEEEL